MQHFPEWKKSDQYLYLLFIILVGTLSSWSSLLDPVLTTNDAGLAEVDIKVKIQSRLIECNVTLIYAGQVNENVSSSRDTLFIEGMVDNLTVTDSGGEDLFYVTEVHGNITVITYQFSHKLVPGEKYSVNCRYYQNSTRIAKYLYEYAIDIDWTGSAGIERVMMLFAPGLNLQMASNPPHFTSAKPLGLELKWFETSSKLSSETGKQLFKAGYNN
ncbi:MAG: hypothetical protein ACFFCQ_06260, partial [Promethearchaeota archaeon]